ncbi:hypothetical protein T484DRAFT_1808224 [Baffinella frigidus]|nr:hypothetical protein T484DRAFT_1808224 [Cryptophyta sp. CCMP2293]
MLRVPAVLLPHILAIRARRCAAVALLRTIERNDGDRPARRSSVVAVEEEEEEEEVVEVEVVVVVVVEQPQRDFPEQ